jgi:antitoxin component YwqK of YwqJK toxin-antitoxin module
MKKLLFLLVFVIFITSGYSQKIKTYYIKHNGEKSLKLYAKFKRTVQNQGDIWVVQDYYLNDSTRMIGNFLNKKLTQKIDIFSYYHPNGKVSRITEYKNGRKHGNEKFYYITGNLSQSANYNLGEATGKWIWYNEDGNIENELDNVNRNVLDENYSHAEYIGGKKKLIEYLKKADYSLQKGMIAIYNRTFTTFEINEEGNVTDVDIIVHGTEEMDSVIIKHLYNMPKWRAAKKNNKYIKSNYVLPIRFSKQSNKVLSDKIIGEAFFTSGVDDYKEKNYKKAIFKIIKAISRNHMEAKYYYLLGHCYYNLKKQDFACENWTIANSFDNGILKKEIKDLCNLK